MNTPPTAPECGPSARGYLHIAAAVESTVGRTPRPRRSAGKSALLRQLSALADTISTRTGARAAVFTARLITPGAGAQQDRGEPAAGYDVAVLLEIDDPAGLDQLPAEPSVQAVIDAVAATAGRTLVMPARCQRSIADVDRSRPGLFLFNYFTGPDPATTQRAWERVAAWYQDHTGLNNSILLSPTTTSSVTFVNHARWDIGLPRLAVRQFGHPSFRNDVVRVLREAHVTAQPIFHDLVFTTHRAGTPVPIEKTR